MTEIYLHFRCTHYRFYGNAPVALWLKLARYRAEASGDRAASIGESDSSDAQHAPAQPRRRHGGRRRATTFSEGADATAAHEVRPVVMSGTGAFPYNL